MRDDPMKDADERREFANDSAAFTDWQATRKRSENIGTELTGGDEGPGFIYEPGYIMDTDGKDANGQPFPRYHLIIERYEWTSDDLGELERTLWERYACDEIANA